MRELRLVAGVSSSYYILIRPGPDTLGPRPFSRCSSKVLLDCERVVALPTWMICARTHTWEAAQTRLEQRTRHPSIRWVNPCTPGVLVIAVLCTG